MAFITIEKVDKNNDKGSEGPKVSILSIIGLLLSILGYFVNLRLGLIITIISIIILVLSILDIKKTFKRGMKVSILGLVICFIFIVINVVLRVGVTKSTKKINNNIIKSSACSSVNAKGNYSITSDGYYVKCVNYICVIENTKTGDKSTFECK